MHNQEQTISQTIIAIDPGASGGIAIMHRGKTSARAMPDDVDLVSILNQYAQPSREPKATVYMEQVGGYIKGNPAPGSAMFNFGDGFGFIRGLCAGLGLRLILVRPQVWQKGIPYAASAKDKAERKRAFKEYAGTCFPGIGPTLKTADALCILNWATAKPNYGGHIAHARQNEQEGEETVIVAKVSKRKPSRYSEAQKVIAWCKANQWEVPLTGTAEFGHMVAYWRKIGGPAA